MKGRMVMGVMAVAVSMVLAGSVFAGVVWQQDFSAGGVVTDYESATPNSGQFHDIGSSGLGSTAIDSNALVLSTPSGAGIGTSSDAGYARCEVGSGGIMNFQTDLTLEWDSNTTSRPYGQFAFGDYPTSATYTYYPHLSVTFAKVELRLQGSAYSIAGVSGHTFDQMYRLSVFMNDSGVTQTYLGPDGLMYTLSATPAVDGDSDPYIAGSYAVWVDDQILVDDATAVNYVHSNNYNPGRVLDSMLAKFGVGEDLSLSRALRFDNMSISDDLPQPAAVEPIPEPSTVALLALGALGLRRRRR